MQTYYAPAERVHGPDLNMNVLGITNNPIIDCLMNVANGLFAVLNEQRQILALNEAFLKLMGITDSAKVLGMRPGEYVRCVHACEMPGGCGTSPYCSTCGAVIAMLAALDTELPQERTCAIVVERDNREVDLFLQARCCPLKIEGNKYLLLFLQDVSIQQQRAHLERTFFHDINNILCGVMGRSEMLAQLDDMHHQLHNGVVRLAQELSMHSALLESMTDTYKPLYKETTANRILDDLTEVFYNHPLTKNRQLTVAPPPHDLPLITDHHLCNRILTNMVCNALEASEPGGEVIAGIEPGGNSVTFYVWNQSVIPQDIARRVFQRNFSTKQAMGRGLGTFSMKFFGEQVLGGQVTFTSTKSKGTTFRFTLLSN